MRVPLSWLREHVALPAGEDGRAVAERLVRAGFEVDAVHRAGEVSGPVVTGRVVSFEAEPQKNGKTIRWCQVLVSAEEGAEPRGIVCGAGNFAPGDVVVVALPGAVLPGGFAISARKTYGHVSDGMICSARELGAGEEAGGILVLDEGTPLGVDAVELLGLRDEVLDVQPTPDRGYALSLRGLARELATAYAVEFHDPAALDVPEPVEPGWPVVLEDTAACPVFVARTVTGLDPGVPSPGWLQRRLALAGMRSVSLAVDVTNYVMLELGQPLHAYDRQRLQGPVVVRRARAGETIETLDGTKRVLDPDDLAITDDSGPIGVAGVMGGASTEISGTTREIVLEAAHFAPSVVSRAARRHALLSEASRRFERGVDPALPAAAAERAVRLLVELGGATAEPATTVAGAVPAPVELVLAPDLPARVVGVDYAADEVLDALRQVGCTVVAEAEGLRVTVPSWRLDLTQPYDLVEEVARLGGYERIPSRLPQPPAGRGWTEEQRARRRVGQVLAAAGLVEAPSYPFVGEPALEALGIGAGDPRHRLVRLANPISDAEPYLRTTLLPGLLAALRRNLGRGQTDVALYETGLVFLAPEEGLPPAPALPVDARPGDDQLAALDAALPAQPRYVAAVLAGQREPAGWWGPGRASGWADAVELARRVVRAAGAEVEVRGVQESPWHPGRCAAVLLPGEDGTSAVVGFAGELHPRVVAALGLPPRTAALELDLDAVVAAGVRRGPVPAPALSTFPVAVQDVALVVDAAVPAAEVEAALRAGAGELLERIRLFDVYTGAGVPEGARSLAYRLELRAPDRTLTSEEASGARDAAVARAAARTGARLRGS
ncbi:phenylalanyl-tRNA synthetase beta subunit [Motilibacter rhizosphaerae]|uniref:Phenylalanine--tRNA ligase beta subunit n=1 Tax=Motilibacter rhizosphaerae TaxID=598652 RepID=A0A4Q7NRG2_9ACTN|nr:phenylalanine--tRNA ligase subunit beta [Motilibacter rhizosphaerae]RZS89348.1 phenylalanyl-tRNA synthetase beta subunit [Motilibacter rhizosphaerae]